MDVKAAQLVVDREKARKQKVEHRRGIRQAAKGLRLMAEMLETDEITEWSINRNWGYREYNWNFEFKRIRNPFADEVTITFRYPLEKFEKMLKRRKLKEIRNVRSGR